MLADILKNKNCFKLVCGAGNEDTSEVEKLVYLYSKAGCNFFDLSANLDVIEAAKSGLKRAGIEKDRYLCVSVGIEGDPHINKAQIDGDKCTKCDECRQICPQNAIKEDIKSNQVEQKKCIGCERCIRVCTHNAITMHSQTKDLKQVLPPIIEKGIDCIELHAIVENDIEVFEKWKELNELFNGMLSICIDRLKLGNEKVLHRITEMIKNRAPYTTIIQADGAPMSGGEDDYRTTLQTIAMAEIIEKENFPAYIVLSGGTNSKTAELARLCGIHPDGIAIGSYARKIVKKYITTDDFFENEQTQNEALQIAKQLVNSAIHLHK